MEIHRDSSAAWRHLVQFGGLELDGRDDSFEAELFESLCSTVPGVIAEHAAAQSLEEALRRTPLTKFLGAFFAVAQPYLRMFQSILRYFEAAGANEGREHWCLALDADVDLDLGNFKTQLAKWESVKGVARVPALDCTSAWKVREILIAPAQRGAEHASGYREQPELPKWLKAWLLGYESGERCPLPQEMLEADLPQQFHSVIPFICAFAYRRINLGLSRQGAGAELHKRKFHYPSHDALDPWSVAAMETDYYLRERLYDLYAARSFPPEDRDAVGRALEELLERFPTRWLDVELSVRELEELLQLPIWKKRSELYAVWVATEIVRALGAHEVRLHHNKGRMEFAFRETLLVSVLTSRPLVEFYSERRSPLSPAARSTTRSTGVQPDYGLWKAGESSADACILAIECKHHKRSAGGKFAEVLSDYAQSLPNANIYLVSHGPIGAVRGDLPFSVKRRCFTIPYFRADEQSTEPRKLLRDAVHAAVGVPNVGGCRYIQPKNHDCILVVDVSLSMHRQLLAAGALNELAALMKVSRAGAVATVDTSIVRFVNPEYAEIESAIQHPGVGTALAAPVQALRPLFKRLVIVTDEEGLATLSELAARRLSSWNPQVCIVEVNGGLD